MKWQERKCKQQLSTDGLANSSISWESTVLPDILYYFVWRNAWFRRNLHRLLGDIVHKANIYLYFSNMKLVLWVNLISFLIKKYESQCFVNHFIVLKYRTSNNADTNRPARQNGLRFILLRNNQSCRGSVSLNQNSTALEIIRTIFSDDLQTFRNFLP